MIVIGWCLTAMSLVVATLTVLAKYAPMRPCAHEEASARSRQADVRADDAVGVSAVLAVADYLVGQSADRSRLVHQALERRLGLGGADSAASGTSCCRSCCCFRSDLKKNPKTIAMIAIYLMVDSRGGCVLRWWNRTFRPSRSHRSAFHDVVAGRSGADRLRRFVAGVVLPESAAACRCCRWAHRI